MVSSDLFDEIIKRDRANDNLVAAGEIDGAGVVVKLIGEDGQVLFYFKVLFWGDEVSCHHLYRAIYYHRCLGTVEGTTFLGDTISADCYALGRGKGNRTIVIFVNLNAGDTDIIFYEDVLDGCSIKCSYVVSPRDDMFVPVLLVAPTVIAAGAGPGDVRGFGGEGAEKFEVLELEGRENGTES